MDTDKSVRDKNKSSDEVGNRKSLILHNDDYHTFNYVIDALIEICNMERVQAIQCTYLVHYKEKCEVKRGSKKELLPMRRALSAKDLKATIH
ncbi:MAG TPA: ATP-dependent Clp protease adaptor ClpS [Prolixibacteraceae bacterium]|nr:ATP-dependent Clp protease adaptor ClpS [Prolixibacteraceae bacterium]